VDSDESFEFERKFLVKDTGVVDCIPGDLLVQGYLLVADNYAVRVRLVVDPDSDVDRLLRERDPRTCLLERSLRYSRAFFTVKSPPLNGVRYEAEMDVDVDVAVNICSRSVGCVIKTRYPVIHRDDLWVVDVFHGKNRPLMIAECERDQPVIKLDIPAFCGEEVTDRPEFTNEMLAIHPYSAWKNQ